MTTARPTLALTAGAVAAGALALAMAVAPSTPARDAPLRLVGESEVLPNVDDDGGRCPTTSAALDVEAYRSCIDAGDREVNGAEDLKDLARVRLEPVRTSSSATIRLEGADDRARIFVERGGQWVALDDDLTSTPAELAQGIDLAVEARSTRAAGWDGRINLTATVGDRVATHELRVAPLRTHTQLDPVTRLFTYNLTDGPGSLTENLTEAAREIGMDYTPLNDPEEFVDPWAQDILEPMYAVVERGSDRHAVRVNVLTDVAKEGRDQFRRMVGPDLAVIDLGAAPTGENTYDAGGNIESFPGPDGPVVVMGHDPRRKDSLSRRQLDFLDAQDITPLLVDSSWSPVGHVDEFLGVLPSNDERGWKLMVASPADGVDVLRRASAQGAGSAMTPSIRIDTQYPVRPARSVSALLGDPALVSVNEAAQRRVDEATSVVVERLGLSQADVVRMPVLLMPPERGEADLSAPGSLSYRLPNAVNGVLSGSSYLVPRQWGPLVDGRDVFQERVEEILRREGVRPRAVDDFYDMHIQDGELHCSTNALRAIPKG